MKNNDKNSQLNTSVESLSRTMNHLWVTYNEHYIRDESSLCQGSLPESRSQLLLIEPFSVTSYRATVLSSLANDYTGQR